MKISRTQIKKAGPILKDKKSFTKELVKEAENKLTYWRTIHGKVLNEFYKIVDKEVKKINSKAYVVQRVKRSPSIIAKLERFPNNQLTTMQDIAGIRAIMKSLDEVEKLREELKKVAKSHEFKSYDNYITNPKESGYRSVHLIYKFNNPTDKETDGLLLEIQIRTELQHSWATAVETMSTFLGTNLKFGQGQPKWLNYFALTSSAFSFLENTPQVPTYSQLDKKETYRQALYEFRYNLIEENLSAFTTAAEHISAQDDKSYFYYILTLNIDKRIVNIKSFSKSEFEKANEIYTVQERKYSKDNKFQVVLVSTESIKELQSAFPNYFLDTREFLKNMEKIKQEYETLK